jgi:hypothetical protein
VQANQDYYRLAERRYRIGVDSNLTFLDAQRNLFSAQQALITDRLSQLTSEVNLYKALGGGWYEQTGQANQQSVEHRKADQFGNIKPTLRWAFFVGQKELTNRNIPFDYRPVPFAANCLTPAQPRTIPHATLPKFITKTRTCRLDPAVHRLAP